MSTVLFKGTFVNIDSTSKDTKTKPSSNKLLGILVIFSAASKESFNVNSLCVKGLSKVVRYCPTD